MKIRQAAFALRVVRRHGGTAAVVYRRTLDDRQQERLTRIKAISPLAYTAGSALLRSAVRAMPGLTAKLEPGPFIPLDPDWGARIACYAVVTAGLRDGDRMHRAAANIQHADGTEAVWWLGVLRNGRSRRALRALRILVEAVK
jgi:hypothetical protein